MRQNRRGPWYLLTGLILGVGLGLTYAWLVAPVTYSDTPPISLRPDYKDQYRTLIALAYAANGDLGRARARLALLGDQEPGQTLANQALRAAAEERPTSEVQSLALLAEALGSPVEIVASTPTMTLDRTPTISPSPSRTSVPTQTMATATTENTEVVTGTPVTATVQPEVSITPLPTLTPTRTPSAPYVLSDREFVCDPSLPGPLIQVYVVDAQEQPVPGIPVEISWPGGQERFFTGLKPEISLGYADYLMDVGYVYTVRIGDGGQIISDLEIADCEASPGRRYPGSWRLTFAQP